MVRCVINTLLLHCNGTRALARLQNDLTSCQALSYSPWMSIQDTAVTLQQHGVNTQVIVREEPAQIHHPTKKLGGVAPTRELEGFFYHTKPPFKPALKNVFHGTSKSAIPWAFSLCLPSQKGGLVAQKKQVSFQRSIPVVDTWKCRPRLGGKALKAAELLAKVLCIHRKARTAFRGRLSSVRWRKTLRR